MSRHGSTPGIPDEPSRKSGTTRPAEASRRDFFRSSAAGLVAATVGAMPAGTAEPAAAQSVVRSGRNSRILLKGGTVLTLDRNIGDFANADVLIEGRKIVAVQPNLKADAQVIDASNTIVMPGFIDTHHHQYETILRSILSDGLLTGPKSYQSEIQAILTPAYRPEDAQISELVASISQINAGVTTGVDTSQVAHTPAHTDACIDGLTKAGRRTLFAYSNGTGSASQYPQDIRRLRKQYFSSDDQLLTLAMGGGPEADTWALARDVGAPIEGARVSHLDHKIGTLTPGKEADIIMLRTDTINVMPLNNAPGAVVTLMDTSNVDTVLIAGTVMKRGGKLVGVDLNRIRRTLEASRDAVLSRARYPRHLFSSCCAGPGN